MNVAWPRPRRRPGRDAREGLIGTYIHTGGRFGALIEVNCETDFVARNEQFQQLVKDLAIQVVALRPDYPSVEAIPADVLDAKKAELLADESVQKKPENIREQIVDGQLRKWYQQVVLTEQPFRDTDQTVGRAHHQRHRHDRREHPRPALRPLRGRRGAVSEDGTAGDARGPGPLRYRRILLKLSGEALLGDRRTASIRRSCAFIADEVAEVHGLGVQIGDRGRRRQHLPRPRRRRRGAWTARPATTWACSRRSSTASRCRTRSSSAGVPTRVMIGDRDERGRRAVHPAARDPPPREGPRRASSSAGTGNPYFTTDTAAALRADRDRRRGPAEGDQGRRRLRQGPDVAPRRRRYAQLDYARSPARPAQGARLDRRHACAWRTTCRSSSSTSTSPTTSSAWPPASRSGRSSRAAPSAAGGVRA